MSNNHSRWIALLSCLVLTLGLFWGCNPKNELPTTKFEISGVEPSQISATVTLSTTGVSQCAYAVYSETPDSEPLPVFLFRDGEVVDCADGTTSFTIKGLEPISTYTLYVAALLTSGEYYDGVLTTSVTTGDYADDLTIVETYPDGFAVNVKVPASVTESSHVLRYTFGNLIMYNQNKTGFMASTDALTLESNGYYGYIEEDTYAIFNNDNIYLYDENGEIATNEYGEEVYIHDPIAPGEPLVFLVGEFDWGESNYGWGEGWYSALFDDEAYRQAFGTGADVNEADYWTGHYRKVTFKAAEPAPLDATVHYETDLAATSGTITFTPDEGVYMYLVQILDEETYQIILEYLGNDESLIPWFNSSYYAAMLSYVLTLQGDYVLDIKDYLMTPQADTEYHLLISVMGDQAGTSQSFIHDMIKTTPKVLEAPSIKVTAIEQDNPFQVGFNVKNTGNVEITSAKYAANYVDEWDSMSYYTDAEILDYLGNEFSASDVAQINSEEGLDVWLNTMDGETTRFGVIAYNSEDTASPVDENAIVEATSPVYEAAEYVESSFFTDLVGDWTMSSSTMVRQYNQETFTNELVDGGVRQAKVSIYNGLNDAPETLPSEIYDVYAAEGISVEETDALYDEFKMELEAFNNKIRKQNRLLCLGFGYDVEGSYYQYYASNTPYDIFCDPTYNVADVAEIFYCFGPKWYIEVDSEGNLSAPFNAEISTPMTVLYSGYYFMGYNLNQSKYISRPADMGDYSSNFASFPVSMPNSDTITVEPLDFAEISYYPAMGVLSYGSATIPGSCYINSELTLTRGWSGSDDTAATTSVKKQMKASAPMYDSVKPKARTSFKGSVKEYKRGEIKILTKDVFEQKNAEYMARYADIR